MTKVILFLCVDTSLFSPTSLKTHRCHLFNIVTVLSINFVLQTASPSTHPVLPPSRPCCLAMFDISVYQTIYLCTSYFYVFLHFCLVRSLIFLHVSCLLFQLASQEGINTFNRLSSVHLFSPFPVPHITSLA